MLATPPRSASTSWEGLRQACSPHGEGEAGSLPALLPGSPGGQAVLRGRPAQPRTFWRVTGRHGARNPLGRKDRAKCAAVSSLPSTRVGGRVGAGDLELRACTRSAPDAQPGPGEEPGRLPGGL